MTERAHYDCWQQLVMLAAPDSPNGKYARIEPTDDPHTCILHYEDGSWGVVYFKNGEWRFPGDGPPSDHATATGMYDR